MLFHEVWLPPAASLSIRASFCPLSSLALSSSSSRNESTRSSTRERMSAACARNKIERALLSAFTSASRDCSPDLSSLSAFRSRYAASANNARFNSRLRRLRNSSRLALFTLMAPALIAFFVSRTVVIVVTTVIEVLIATAASDNKEMVLAASARPTLIGNAFAHRAFFSARSIARHCSNRICRAADEDALTASQKTSPLCAPQRQNHHATPRREPTVVP